MSPYYNITTTPYQRSYFATSLFFAQDRKCSQATAGQRGPHGETDRHKRPVTTLFFAKQSPQPARNASSTSNSHPPAPYMRAQPRDAEREKNQEVSLCPELEGQPDRSSALHSCTAVGVRRPTPNWCFAVDVERRKTRFLSLYQSRASNYSYTPHRIGLGSAEILDLQIRGRRN